LAFSPSPVAIVLSRAAAKNPKAPRASADPRLPKMAWQDAMRSTSKLRLQRKNDTMSCFS
jgi:hypothetical protein